ncbi:hypothetical protein SARC_07235 [Sphaeroforma arctica JP610]|uniref:Bulb-type lectin domain-containing protein n=1 Tax=Sphaeroforma arctica JP610 TaxID=667725 RepID=A0A0L0FV16_9EUKA|nr:hypothetical protein SARC_07235 [Sphaeroforma arctica JP610]KNC80406.1 hypothetical protein SARC_07235 [Sphaeroforma arctica JP610]|eukprot:XP_014154308.1 hypothetical protein SARC_07235 [Sphaeroforma arctica JP610]
MAGPEATAAYQGFDAPSPVGVDKDFYAFKPSGHDNTPALAPGQPPVLLATEIKQLVERHNLTALFAHHKKDYNPRPSMYALVDHLPGIPVLSDTLFPGDCIKPNEGLKSASGATFSIDVSGDLLITMNDNRVWEPRTSGLGGTALFLTEEGKLSLVNAQGAVVWSVQPEDPEITKPVKCKLRYDGNLVIIDKRNSIVWDSKSGDPQLLEEAEKYERQSWLYSLIETPNMSNRALEPLDPSRMASVFKLEPRTSAGRRPMATDRHGARPATDSHRHHATGGHRTHTRDDPRGHSESGEPHRKKVKREKKDKKEKKAKKSKSAHKHRHSHNTGQEGPPPAPG